MDLGELLSQLPPTMLIYGLMIPVICFGLIGYLTLIRPRLKKRREPSQNPPSVEQTTTYSVTPSPVAQTVAKATPPPLDDDLPDIGLLLAQTEKRPAPAPTSTPTPRPSGPRQLGEAEVVLITGQTVRAREELVLLRDPADGRLIVQMPGVTYKSFLSAPAAKANFTQLMNELAKSLSQPEAVNTPVTPQPTPPAAPPDPISVPPTPPTPSAPPAASETPPPAPELPTESLPPLQPYTPPPPVAPDERERLPGDLPRYSNMRGAELKGRGFLGRPKFEFERIPDLNLAESIEAYLQYRLVQTPGYGKRPWHIHPAADGGVRIEVDGKFFDSVSDITDPEARSFIQSAIQEWQDRQ